MTADQDLSARLARSIGTMRSAYLVDAYRSGQLITLADHERAVQAAVAKAVEAERAIWMDALDPNARKADYIGEVQMPVTAYLEDDGGDMVETTHQVLVDWTAMKEIMAMIKAAAIRSRGVAG